MQPHALVLRADAEHAADLFRIHSRHVAQHEHLALHRRKRVHCLTDALHGLLAQQPRLRHVRPRVGNLLPCAGGIEPGLIDCRTALLAITERPQGRERQHATLLTPARPRHVERYAENPCLERRSLLETVEVLEHGQPGLFFFNDTATTEIYTLSLHDALPIFRAFWGEPVEEARELEQGHLAHAEDRKSTRLNSSHRTISYAVFCLKKKKN